MTVLLGVPTMCIALSEAARHAERLPPVRIAHVGGAAVTVEVGATSSETSGRRLRGLRNDGDDRHRDDVQRRPGAQARLGRIPARRHRDPHRRAGRARRRRGAVSRAVRDPRLLGRPQATAEAISSDGWLATGDLGYLDDEGYLFLVDRKKELINRGGYKVYPREVEEVLYAHPDVLEVAVIGIPDELLGEEVAAIVVPRPGSSRRPTSSSDWTKERVAAYKYPRRILIVDDLPKGPTGKILKRAIDRAALLG